MASQTYSSSGAPILIKRQPDIERASRPVAGGYHTAYEENNKNGAISDKASFGQGSGFLIGETMAARSSKAPR